MLGQVYCLDLKVGRLSFNKYRFHIEPHRINFEMVAVLGVKKKLVKICLQFQDMS